MQDILDISEIPFCSLRNVVDIFFFNIFLNATKKKNIYIYIYMERHCYCEKRGPHLCES